MGTEISTARAVKRLGFATLPALITDAGKRAGERFVEFFTATIRNKNTRAAYARAVGQFCAWCEGRGLRLEQVTPVAVAAYIEQHGGSKPTVKQHLAAIRMMFDYLVTGGVLAVNPAASVKGPKYVIKTGKTPVLSGEEARQLLERIADDSIVGLRDRALLGLMVYSFARVSAVVAMRVEDYYQNGKRWYIRLHEKGGKSFEMPVHHKAEEYLDAYLTAAGIGVAKKSPLFRSAAGRTGTLSDKPLSRVDVFYMVKRRARVAGISERVGCHSFRATGITVYLKNGGSLETAQRMANHESIKTTRLYDRRHEQITLDEVERIVL